MIPKAQLQGRLSSPVVVCRRRQIEVVVLGEFIAVPCDVKYVSETPNLADQSARGGFMIEFGVLTKRLREEDGLLEYRCSNPSVSIALMERA